MDITRLTIENDPFIESIDSVLAAQGIGNHPGEPTMSEDIALSGVTTTESTSGGDMLNIIEEAAEIHRENDMMSEMSLPLPPSQDELQASAGPSAAFGGGGLEKNDSGYGDKSPYAEINFEDFEKSAKSGGIKLGPAFTDLDSLDAACADDEDPPRSSSSTNNRETGITEARNPTLYTKRNEVDGRVSVRESTRNLLSEMEGDDDDQSLPPVPSVTIRRQPSSASGMVVFPYDPQSKQTLERLSAEHRSHGQLKRLISKELSKISRDADVRVQSLNGGLSYPAFLKDMLFDDEFYMFNKSHLRFSSVVFENLQEIISDSVQGPGRARTFGVKAPQKQPLLSGRAYITNHRLILLSAEKQRGASVSPRGQGKSAYHLRAVNRDTLDYLSIPLPNIRGMELHASLGYSASANIGSRNLFFGLLNCCESLLPGESSCTKWFTRDRNSHGTNNRIITLGVMLPPWLHPTNIHIHATSEMGMRSIRDFLVELQHITPALRTKPHRPIVGI